jgi:hypothetical protein
METKIDFRWLCRYQCKRKRSPRTRSNVTTSNRADRVFRCIDLFWLVFVLVLVLSPTGRYSYSVRIVALYHCVLVNALVGVGITRWKVNQIAEDGKRVAASRFGVSDNRDDAIDDEPSSTSTVRLRVLSTSTRGSCSAMARTRKSWYFEALRVNKCIFKTHTLGFEVSHRPPARSNIRAKPLLIAHAATI